VQQIKLLNEGKYLHEVMHVDNKADFCIGVAGYPEAFESIFYGLKKKLMQVLVMW
jgi:hypothetical protein